MTTTETESIEALHLWLATELSELRRQCHCLGYPGQVGYGYVTDCWACFRANAHEPKCDCDSRGWVPNVETDALLEALRARDDQYAEVDFIGGSAVWTVSILTRDEKQHLANGATAHEALCRAARKALEAAS